MNTILIVLALAALIVGVVIFVRHKGREDKRPPEDRHDQDTGWNDPTGGSRP